MTAEEKIPTSSEKEAPKTNKEQTEDKMNCETFKFVSDIERLLVLIVSAVYQNKDVYIRELISNSSDALEKIRFKALQIPSVLDTEKELKIQIIPDKDNNTLTFRDTGVGMSQSELVHNLGTIANSGTKKFIDSIQAGGDISMIGQFGIGFYSSFLVAKKVQVRSKSNDDCQHVWESTGKGEFNVYDDSNNKHQLTRGTEVILHLKEDSSQYMETDKLKDIVKKYNQFLTFPIELWTSEEVEQEVTDDEEQEKITEVADEKKEDDSETKITEVKDDEDKPKEKKKKKVKKIENKFKTINQSQPLWNKKSKDITKEEFTSLYKSITNDWEDHLHVKVFKVEGECDFSGVIFVPKRAPFDMFSGSKTQNNIKLYVRNIFITDDSKLFCPEYLSFVKGVIDGNDLPLTLSRENLQQQKILKVIKKNIVKQSLSLLKEVCEDDEKRGKMLPEFAKNIKLGIHEDSANRAALAELLRYPTNKHKDSSFRDYVERMKKKQTNIYYITGESIEAVKNSPFLEKLNELDLEVIYMVDPIDEYAVQQLNEYDGKKLVSVTKENLDLNMSEDDKNTLDKMKKEWEPFTKKIKAILGSPIEKVELSIRMVNSPCTIVTGQYGWSARMEGIVKCQALRNSSLSGHMASKKTFEINPKNKVMQKLKSIHDEDPTDKTFKDLIYLLYQSSMLTSGFTLDDPSGYFSKIYNLIKLGIGIEEEEEDKEALKNLPPLEKSTDGEDKEGEEPSVMEEVD